MGDRTAPILVVQHLEPEGPGLVADALARAGHRIEVVRTDLGQAVPTDLAGYSALVVMGGPMSAGSDDGFPSREAEVALLRDGLDRRLPVLGICLGAQLLAVAGGAGIRRGPQPEIGWGAVRTAPGASGDPLFGDVADELTVLHWHGDTFDLPDGAVHLASSAAYRNQAFRLGPTAWGLQFHLEVGESQVHGFVDAFRDEADDPDAIVDGAPGHLARSAAARALILDRFAALV